MFFWTNIEYRPGVGGARIAECGVSSEHGQGVLMWYTAVVPDIHFNSVKYWFYTQAVHPHHIPLLRLDEATVAQAKRMCEALLLTKTDLRSRK